MSVLSLLDAKEVLCESADVSTAMTSPSLSSAILKFSSALRSEPPARIGAAHRGTSYQIGLQYALVEQLIGKQVFAERDHVT